MGSPEKAPYLTTVILAWQRRHFVQGAVDSVLASDFPASEREVVVVKGFEDETIDAWLEGRGVRSVYCPQGPSGIKHAYGLQVARGEVVCWLDDDDEFQRGKLAHVAQRFRDDPALAYLHHGHQRMDMTGGDLGPGPYIPDFNCSCVAVRRQALYPIIPALLQVNGICDTLQCYGVMALGGKMLHEPDLRLTRYRVSPTPNLNFDLLPSYAQLAEEITRLPAGPERSRALANVIRIYLSTLARTPCERQAEAAELLWLAVRNLSPASYIPDLREVVCAGLHPLSPQLSRWLYARLRRGEVDWLAVNSQVAASRAS